MCDQEHVLIDIEILSMEYFDKKITENTKKAVF